MAFFRRIDATPEVVTDHLGRFAERAWRRPVSASELVPYLEAYEEERAAGEDVSSAYQVALLGVADFPSLSPISSRAIPNRAND